MKIKKLIKAVRDSYLNEPSSLDMRVDDYAQLQHDLDRCENLKSLIKVLFENMNDLEQAELYILETFEQM